ncbi:MAG: UDP-N-acetylmuramate dehydrogenase [Eubacterium sp.]|nr:UDP-N-acetylmuramate dehydrogenase [Eubacterium sp.]MBQ9321967.1 UDP-N-acetylmuramate dehydrogenase [Eubacterium sp.]
MNPIYEMLAGCVGEEQIRISEPMSRHTTFRIGGPADWFVMPRDAAQIGAVIAGCRDMGIPWFVLGNGSNLLVSDTGYRGVVIQIYKNMDRFSVAGTTLRASAGALLSSLAAAARDAELTGMEFASGIPGTLGGAVYMNAGAYGGEMKDILRTVTVLDAENRIRQVDAGELEMGYRTSCVKTKKWIVLEAEIELCPGSRDAITEKMEELKEKRTAKQPLNYPSAGSTFKRPEGLFAGKLIMDAGLAGASVNDAQISEKHCGFLINRGAASAEDVWKLMMHVRAVVKEQFGVLLEPEVRLLGDFPEQE